MTNAAMLDASAASLGGAGFADHSPLPRLDAFRRAQNHSRKVRVLKWVLPAVALTFATVFVSFIYRASAGTPVIQADGSALTADALVMSDPKLKGFTREGRPYAVDADRASQALKDESVIQLAAIKAKLPVNEKDWMFVQAPAGVYDRDANTLTLEGGYDQGAGIKVTYSDKTVIRMRTAVVDLDAGTLQATDNVNLKRSDGAISAETAEYSKDGAVLTFESKVRMTLDPGKPGDSKSDDVKPDHAKPAAAGLNGTPAQGEGNAKP